MKRLLAGLIFFISAMQYCQAYPFSGILMDERDLSIRSLALGQTGVVSVTTPDAMFINPASTSNVKFMSIQVSGQYRKTYTGGFAEAVGIDFRANTVFNQVSVMMKPIQGKKSLEGHSFSLGFGLGRIVDESAELTVNYPSAEMKYEGGANLATVVLAAKNSIGSEMGLSLSMGSGSVTSSPAPQIVLAFKA